MKCIVRKIISSPKQPADHSCGWHFRIRKWHSSVVSAKITILCIRVTWTWRVASRQYVNTFDDVTRVDLSLHLPHSRFTYSKIATLYFIYFSRFSVGLVIASPYVRPQILKNNFLCFTACPWSDQNTLSYIYIFIYKCYSTDVVIGLLWIMIRTWVCSVQVLDDDSFQWSFVVCNIIYLSDE